MIPIIQVCNILIFLRPAKKILKLKKQDIDFFENGMKLPLIEQFYTIQGEGYHVGKAAYFIRIGGCDIGCSWCDTKFSWSPGNGELTTIEDILQHILQTNADSVVVTGGEPSLYNLDPFCKMLKEHKIRTFIETSGAYILRGDWDWICLSPKKQNPPHITIFNRANELKVIISKPEDFIWAEENAAKVHAHCKLYLQAEWGQFQSIIHQVVEYAKNNPKWQVSIQAHKFMHIP
jgi:7-carboxy-7-deazaguanine synthase